MKFLFILLLLPIDIYCQKYLKCFDFSKQKPIKDPKVFYVKELEEEREEKVKDVEALVGVSLLYSNDFRPNNVFYGQRITILNRKLSYFDRLITIGYYQNKDRVSFIPILIGIRKELLNLFYIGFNLGANISYGKPIGSIVSPNIGISKNRLMLDISYLNATHIGNKIGFIDGVRYTNRVVTLYYKL